MHGVFRIKTKQRIDNFNTLRNKITGSLQALLVVTLLAFVLRAVNLDAQSLWRDEVDSIRFSSWPLDELLAGLFRVGHNGPLFFFGMHFWRALAGDSEFALRYPSVLLGTLAVPLGFVLTRQLGFSRRAGLLLGLLLATSPYLVWYGQEAKMYAMLLALVAISFIAYLKALRGVKRWRWWAVFVIATSLSFYTHILSPLMLAVYLLVAFIYFSHLRRNWRGWLISMSCFVLPYVPLVIWQLPILLKGFNSGHPFYPLKKQFFLLLKLYSSSLLYFYPGDLLRQIPYVESSDILLFVFLVLCGLFLSRKQSLVGRLILAGWVLLPTLLVYFVSLRVPVFEDRYVIYITPAFYLLTALGIIAVYRYSSWIAGLLLALVLVINLTTVWRQQHQPIKADFRAATEYLAGQPSPPSVIMIQTPYLRYTLDYYYKGDYILLEGLWTNDNRTERMVFDEMTFLTAGMTDLWLVISEEELWDSRRLTRNWLNKQAELVDEAHFMRVDLYHYQLRSAFPR